MIIDLQNKPILEALKYFQDEIDLLNNDFIGQTYHSSQHKQIVPSIYFGKNNDYEILQNTIMHGVALVIHSTANYMLFALEFYDNPYERYYDANSNRYLTLLKIKRTDITNWQKENEINFNGLKGKKSKEIMLGMPIAGGIPGSLFRGAFNLVGKLEDDTEERIGHIYYLKFLSDGVEKSIPVISEISYSNNLENFLNTHWKNSMPAKPIEKVKEGCFIATACYGDYEHPSVIILREFRDNYLLKNSIGKKFTLLYYKFSPRLANVIKEKSSLKKIVRIIIINPIVWAIKNK